MLFTWICVVFDVSRHCDIPIEKQRRSPGEFHWLPRNWSSWRSSLCRWIQSDSKTQCRSSFLFSFSMTQALLRMQMSWMFLIRPQNLGRHHLDTSWFVCDFSWAWPLVVCIIVKKPGGLLFQTHGMPQMATSSPRGCCRMAGQNCQYLSTAEQAKTQTNKVLMTLPQIASFWPTLIGASSLWKSTTF